MRYLFLLIVISTTNNFASGQTNKIQELSVSQIFLWNNTTIYDTYSGARASNETGSAWSSGTNVNYSLCLTKKLFATIGLGYLNQRFGVNRGFDFYEPNVTTGLFYTTKNYSYKSFNYFGGIGYQVKIKKAKGKILSVNSEVRFSAIANFYNTFQQEFQHDFGENFLGNPNPQIRKKSYQYGTAIQLKAGVVRPVYKKFKVGIDLVMPVYNKLRKDEIFKENPDEYHGVNFSIGTAINLIYNLKN
jgi:hypothetical protein